MNPVVAKPVIVHPLTFSGPNSGLKRVMYNTDGFWLWPKTGGDPMEAEVSKISRSKQKVRPGNKVSRAKVAEETV